MANNNFEYRALGAYKQELFKLICYDELSDCLMDLVMPHLDDDRFDKIDNFLGGDFQYHNSSGKTEMVELDGHLLDVPFVYNVITDARCVICIDTNITENSKSLKEMYISISVMCHKAALKLSSDEKKRCKNLGYIGRNRIDVVVGMLGDILNHSDIKAIGRLEPVRRNPVKPYYPNTDFFGKILDYTATDFMIDYGARSLGGE